MNQHLKELVCKLKRGDKVAFEEIYGLFHKKIYLFCIGYGLPQVDAEEITQEVFIKLWLKRTSIDEDKSLNSYLYKIGKNIIIDEFKKKIKIKATQEYQMSLIIPCNNVEEDMDYKDLQKQMEETLMYLPERRREIFELSRVKGLSHKEIAEELGISTKTVENHLTQALNNFRVALQNTNFLLFGLILLLL